MGIFSKVFAPKADNKVVVQPTRLRPRPTKASSTATKTSRVGKQRIAQGTGRLQTRSSGVKTKDEREAAKRRHADTMAHMRAKYNLNEESKSRGYQRSTSGRSGGGAKEFAQLAELHQRQVKAEAEAQEKEWKEWEQAAQDLGKGALDSVEKGIAKVKAKAQGKETTQQKIEGLGQKISKFFRS